VSNEAREENVSDEVRVAMDDAERIRQTGMIYRSMVGVMRDCKAIAKDNRNKEQNYLFRGIDDAYNELHAFLVKNGVFTTSSVLESETSTGTTRSGKTFYQARLLIKYTFWALDGTNVSSEIWGWGFDTSDKAANKAQAVAHKYALLQAFAIPTKDPKDPEDHTIEGAAPNRGRPRESGVDNRRIIDGRLNEDYQRRHSLICGKNFNEVISALKEKDIDPAEWSEWLDRNYNVKKAIDIPAGDAEKVLGSIKDGSVGLPF
jgi:hypothetical protein